jgi:type II secretory pathway component PulF
MAATATFEYKVRDSAGKLKSGKIEAETPGQVAAKLKGMGLAPAEHHPGQHRDEQGDLDPGLGQEEGQAQGPGRSSPASSPR